jgi:hypothetical protein
MVFNQFIHNAGNALRLVIGRDDNEQLHPVLAFSVFGGGGDDIDVRRGYTVSYTTSLSQRLFELLRGRSNRTTGWAQESAVYIY